MHISIGRITCDVHYLCILTFSFKIEKMRNGLKSNRETKKKTEKQVVVKLLRGSF